MSTVIFDDYGLAISKDKGRFYLIYNAGAYGIAMREDPISDEEAAQIMSGPRAAMQVVRDVQRRLAEKGVRQSASNAPRF